MKIRVISVALVLMLLSVLAIGCKKEDAAPAASGSAATADTGGAKPAVGKVRGGKVDPDQRKAMDMERSQGAR